MLQTRVPSVSRIVMVTLGLWLAVAAITNIIDLVSAMMGDLTWGHGSGNLFQMAGLMAVYFRPPLWLLEVLLAGVIVIEAAAAAFFLLNRTALAFALALALFCAFIIVDDIFLGYQIEASHRTIFIMLCAAYLLVLVSNRGVQAEP